MSLSTRLLRSTRPSPRGLRAVALAILAPALLGSATAMGDLEPSPEVFEVRGLPATLQGPWLLALGEHAGAPTADLPHGIGPWTRIRLPGTLERGAGRSWDGHAWLSASFRVSDELRGEALAIRFRRLCDADEVFLNGARIGGTGSFPPGFSSAPGYQRVYSVPADLLRFGEPNRLLVHVYAFGRSRCPFPDAPELGRLETQLRGASASSALVVAFAVFFAMVAANHTLMPVFLPRAAARPNLLFALFAAVSAAYVGLHLSFLASDPAAAGLLDRVRLALLPVAVAVLAEFVFAFFDRRPPAAVRALQGALGLAAALPLLSPILLGRFPYRETVFVLAAGLAVFAGHLVVRSISLRVEYARPLGVVLLVYALSGLWDLSSDVGLLPRPVTSVAGMVFPIGFVPFYVVMGLILAHRHWQHYRLATRDSLTELLRREAFLARLGEEIERAMRTGQVVVAAMVDLDGFKRVNDTLSHAAGDLALRSTARLMRSSLRPFDLVGRWGGDELCAALVVSDGAEGLAALDRVRASVASERFEIEGRTFRLTASIGAAEIAGQRVAPSRLLTAADRALYRAKAAGGDRVERVVLGGPGEALPRS